jgi:ABC-type amino acid transport substrate-binding protein
MKAIGSAGFLIAGIAIAYAQADIAPTGTLRAAYLATNPAQAIRDAHTGEVRGVSFDLARELAKQIGKPLDFKPIAGPPVVIDAVRSGKPTLASLRTRRPGSEPSNSRKRICWYSRASWYSGIRRSLPSPISTASV